MPATEGREQDHYEVLGVSRDAPDDAIRTAYRALASKHHPDRNQDDPDAELRLKRLNVAFHVLGDPAQRRQYDERTRSPESGGQHTLDGDPAPWKTTAANDSPEPERRFWPVGLALGLGLVAAIAGARQLWKDSPTLAQGPHPPPAAGAAAPPVSTLPYVVPLLPHEAAPSIALNYFEPATPSVGLIVGWYEACQSRGAPGAPGAAGPPLDPVRKDASCACDADIRRRKFGPKTWEVTLTARETHECLAAARAGVPSPYAFASPMSTTEIWREWSLCRERNESTQGSYCACAQDLELAVKSGKVKPSLRPLLLRRCEMEHEYWKSTQKHLTLRQFVELTPTQQQPTEPLL